MPIVGGGSARRTRVKFVIAPAVVCGTARTRANAVSRALIHAWINAGWLIRNGAIPRPVELPTPNRRRISLSSRTAVVGEAMRARCSTMSIVKLRMSQTASNSGRNEPANSGRSCQALRCAAPYLQDQYTAVVRIKYPTGSIAPVRLGAIGQHAAT